MATFSYTPDYGISKAKKPNVMTVQFGDGYEQRFAKGLNSSPGTFPLRFSNRDLTEANAIEAFFEARGGVEAFDWTPPDSMTAIRVKCSEWSKTFERGNFFTITCTFVQVFEPNI